MAEQVAIFVVGAAILLWGHPRLAGTILGAAFLMAGILDVTSSPG